MADYTGSPVKTDTHKYLFGTLWYTVEGHKKARDAAITAQENTATGGGSAAAAGAPASNVDTGIIDAPCNSGDCSGGCSCCGTNTPNSELIKRNGYYEIIGGVSGGGANKSFTATVNGVKDQFIFNGSGFYDESRPGEYYSRWTGKNNCIQVRSYSKDTSKSYRELQQETAGKNTDGIPNVYIKMALDPAYAASVLGAGATTVLANGTVVSGWTDQAGNADPERAFKEMTGINFDPAMYNAAKQWVKDYPAASVTYNGAVIKRSSSGAVRSTAVRSSNTPSQDPTTTTTTNANNGAPAKKGDAAVIVAVFLCAAAAGVLFL